MDEGMDDALERKKMYALMCDRSGDNRYIF